MVPSSRESQSEQSSWFQQVPPAVPSSRDSQLQRPFLLQQVPHAGQRLPDSYAEPSSGHSPLSGDKCSVQSMENVTSLNVWKGLGLPSEVLPGSRKGNPWRVVETKPSGPCSNIQFDSIGGRDATHLINMSDPDVLEIWNLGLVNYNPERDKPPDCGMECERSFSALQGRRSDYDNDIFTPTLETLETTKREANGSAYQGGGDAEDVNDSSIGCCMPTDRVQVSTISSSGGGHPKNDEGDCASRRSMWYIAEELSTRPGFYASLVPAICQLLGVTFPEVNRNLKMMVDTINEEETQVVKAVTRDCGWLEFTKGGLSGKPVIPGSVARRPYHTYGSLADLTRLMSEENGLTTNMVADDRVSVQALLLLQEKGLVSDDTITLNGHVVGDLQGKEGPPTNDSFKIKYLVVSSGKSSYCEFERPTPNVIAIRHRKEIVQEFSSGTECGVLLDQIDLYPEFGGQTFDEDVIIGVANEEIEFPGKCVHKCGRYVVNIGTFATSTEESVVEGVHRIVALVGPETFKALKMAKLLLNEIDAGTAKMNVPAGKMDKTLPVREAYHPTQNVTVTIVEDSPISSFCFSLYLSIFSFSFRRPGW